MHVGATFYSHLKSHRKSFEGLIAFQDAVSMELLCPYYVKDHIKGVLHWQMISMLQV